MKKELMRISQLAEENLTREIRYVEGRGGAPAAEIIYQDEKVTIAWPLRQTWHEAYVAWKYTIDPIPPGTWYREQRDHIQFLFAEGKRRELAVTDVPERKNLFPSQESWLETVAWLMEKAGLSGPKQALKATLLSIDNDLDISL